MPITSGINANIFRAVSGSLFSTPANWSRGVVPTGSDVADIRDNCTIDISRTIGTLVVRPGITASINTGLTLQVNDTINVMGHLSCSGAPSIISYARKNIINSLSPGTSTYIYTGSINQSVAGVNYHNLNISSISVNINAPTPSYIKTLIGNVSVSGSLLMRTNTVLELDRYNLNISGSTGFGGSFFARLKKSQPGNVVFNGLIDYSNSSTQQGIDFESGNPNVEVRNGINFGDASPLYFNSGKGTWTFTTNPNQTIVYNQGSSTQGRTWDCPIVISGSTSLTASAPNPSDARQFLQLNEPINGTSPSSLFFVNGRVYFGTLRSAVDSMRTGSFDFTSSANSTIGYTFVDNYTLPYNYYRGLHISGDGGTKTITSNLSISGSLTILNGSTLELSSNNLSVSGTTQFVFVGPKITKSGPGTVTFRGPFNIGLSSTTAAGLNFSVGNPSRVEFQNGIAWGDTSNVIFNLGTGSTQFTTNNQVISSGTNSTMSFYGPVNIENIAVTNSLNNAIYLYAPMNGTTVGSIFKNNTNLYFANSASLSGSFVTGTLDLTTVNNTVGFFGNYTGTTSPRLNTFFNLLVSGTGIKTLGTSSFISGSLTFPNDSIGGALELSSSNLTVNGSTLLYQYSNLTKSGPGNVIFNGVVSISTGVASSPNIDFSAGNPTIEVRNGMNGGGTVFLMNTGTGSLNFTTNNQTIDFAYVGDAPKFRSPIIINGIQLTIEGRLAGRAIYTFYNTIDGTNANSRLVNNGWMRFTSASITNPMSTFGTFTHTGSIYSYIDYCFDGDFAIPYSNYFGLAIGGTGSKYPTKDLTVTELLASSGSNSVLNIGNYNFTNLGRTSTLFGGTLFIRNPGSGSVLFSGPVDQYLNFSGSTGTTEFRNGLANNSNISFFTGTGNWIFSTNNQGLDITYSGARDFDCSITISGSITVSIPAAGPGIATHNFRGPINGTVAGSRFLMNTNSSMNYFNSATPMSTGILDVTSSLGTTFTYASGSQNIKGGIYRNLTMLSGSKTLQGNVSVLGTLSTGSGAGLATINYNGFTLTNP